MVTAPKHSIASDTPSWVHFISCGNKPPEAEFVRAQLDKFELVILRDCSFTGQTLLEYSSQFGPPLKKAGVSEIVNLIPDVKNTDRRKTFSSTTEMCWHSDRSFDEPVPTWSFLYASTIGAGAGTTSWGNNLLAFENLPKDVQMECLQLSCRHELAQFSKTYNDEIYGFVSPERQKVAFSRAQSEKKLVEHWNGRPYLNINRGYTSEILGKDKKFLAYLLEQTEHPAVTYTHSWRTGDLAISNNRVLIHCREKSQSDARVMIRVLVS